MQAAERTTRARLRNDRSEPEPTSKSVRTRKSTDKTTAEGTARKVRRTTQPKSDEASQNAVEEGNGKARLVDVSDKPASCNAIDDDDDLPSIVSPSPSSDSKTFTKHEVVWVNYKNVFWPCLLTNVHRRCVNFKFINGSRKKSQTYRASMSKVKKFDDPNLNARLLEEGGKQFPPIIAAYNRVVQYYCHLSAQKDLSALKFLTYDKVGDLLYGLVPETDSLYSGSSSSSEAGDNASYSTEVVSHSDEEDNSDAEGNSRPDAGESSSAMEFSCSGSQDTLSDEDYQELVQKLNRLLSIIESEECYKYLEDIYTKSIPSERMDLYNNNEEIRLAYRSGYGPFIYGKNRKTLMQTDHLHDILDRYVEKLLVSQPSFSEKDTSLFLRYVMLPEAVIFSIQRHFNCDREEAERQFSEWKEL